MKLQRAPLFAIVLLVVLMPSQARGRIGYTERSVEYRTAIADVVVHVEMSLTHDFVVEVYKGALTADERAALDHDPRMQRGGHLVFLHRNRGKRVVTEVLPDGPRLFSSKFGIDRDGRPIKDMDELCALVRRSASIKLLRDDAPPNLYANSWAGNDPVGGVYVPIRAKQYVATTAFLAVPLDYAQELRARADLVARPGSSIAIRTLVHLKNAENASLLRAALPLADDEVFASGRGRGTTWRYPTRYAAYRTLTFWGERVARPRMEGPDDFYHELPMGALVGGAIFLALSRARTIRRSPQRAVFGSVIWTFGIASVLLLAAMLVARGIAVDIELPTSASQQWLTVRFDRLEWTTLEARKKTPSPLRIAFFQILADPTVRDHFAVRGNPILMPPSVIPILDLQVQDAAGSSELSGSPALTIISMPVIRVLFTIALVPLIAIAWRVVNRLRWRTRLRANQCRSCGYDLRASPERCPECGAIRLSARRASPAI